MGIQNLLQELSPFIRNDAHIREFQGQVVAIDGFGWLHRGYVAPPHCKLRPFSISRCIKPEPPSFTHSWRHSHTSRPYQHRCYGCARQIACGVPTNSYVNYFMRKIALLKHYGVRPLAVFDGAHSAAKALTDSARAARRARARAEGLRALAAAHALRDDSARAAQLRVADEHFQKVRV